MTLRIATSDISADWRKFARHDVVLDLRYMYRSGDVNYVGTGRTRNLGGETVCFEVDQPIALKSQMKGEVELRIVWPYQLQNVCNLELVVKGRLIRTEAVRAVLRMESCEFQTLGARSFSQASSCGMVCDLAA